MKIGGEMLTLDARPFSLDDVVGQKATIREMKKRSKNMEFPEVMIFSGPTGTGKSTLARILGALVNDPNPLARDGGWFDPNPESDVCKSIIEEKFNRDVHEFDASQMGKDDVANLQNLAATSPMFDKKKFIIVDEAQLLSKAGKGTVLKLLEKKRKNTHIVLCTMDISSFDKAVKGRGQFYNFKPPTSTEIAEHLLSLVPEEVEGSEYFFTKGLYNIADSAGGSVREAVGLLERCLMAEIFSEEEMLSEMQIMSNDQMGAVILKILKGDNSAIKSIIDMGIEEFYHKSKKALLDAVLYHNTGYYQAQWKVNLAEQVKRAGEYKGLAKIFVDLWEQNYFKPDLFLYRIGEFMASEPEQKVESPVREGVPSRSSVKSRTPVPSR